MRVDTFEKHIVTSLSKDLYMSYFGQEKVRADAYSIPAVRDHYLYVYVLKGKGAYKIGDTKYPMRENQAFVLFPHQWTSYWPDPADPWEYRWFGFGGSAVPVCLERGAIGTGAPIVTHRRPERMRRLFDELIGYKPVDGIVDELFYNGNLHAMLAEICSQNTHVAEAAEPHADHYVRRAKSFMRQHFDKDIRVDDVARFAGLERSYFSKLFKARTGESPYVHIMNLRCAEARRLLAETPMPIEHIALIIGFKDSYHFSSFFKQKVGISPLPYRQNAQRRSESGGE